jgi:outer membrane protein OmpA-like peptidoglycan-associated protein
MPISFQLIGPVRADDAKPLWEANLTVEQEDWLHLAGPVNQARTVFLQPPVNGRHWPSAMLARCRIRDLTVRLPGHNNLFLDAPDLIGGVVSLMVQNPKDGGATGVTAYLLHGDLPLDLVWHADEWAAHPAIIPGFADIKFIRLTADGLSFAADGVLPWIATPLRARYLLRCPFDADGNGRQEFQITLDRRDPAPDRTTASETVMEQFIQAFQSLRAIVSPPPAVARPAWQELELSAEAIPSFHWRIANGTTEFHLDAGTLELHVADSAPPLNPESQQSRRVSTIQPEWLVKFDPSLKTLDLAVFGSSPAAGPRATWAWTDASSDTLTLDEILTSDDALATALWVRGKLELPRPNPLPKGTDRQSLLFAFAPVSDGWTHWPIPNVITEDYLPPPPPPPTITDDMPGLMSGAVVYEYRPRPDARPRPAQNPWTVTILQGDALGAGSIWRFDVGSNPARIKRATTCVLAPTLDLDGFLWLSVRKPTVEDALPDLVDHLSHLRAISLHSLDSDDDFPSAFRLTWNALKIELIGPTVNHLAGWDMSLGVNPSFAIKGKAWVDAFHKQPLNPFLFRRHPTLPFIQSLPFLQSQDPPSFPAASRELAILTQPWKEDFGSAGWLDPEWKFTSHGAGWPDTLTPPAVATEWQNAGLPLASLTLPGLTIDPRPLPLLPRGPFDLTAQYWYGLPYLDQLHALSQMPPKEEDDGQSTAQQGATSGVTRERKPLDRQNFGDWWTDLSSHQFLARTEAAECLAPHDGGGLQVDALVEPHLWPVAATLDEDYPGELTLKDSTTAILLPLSREDALCGFRGSWSLVGKEIQLQSVTPATGADFLIIAGSMAAAQRGDQYLRDQRGLYRLASTVVNSGGHDVHVDTPLEFHGTKYLQRTLLQPLQLTGADDDWSFLMAGVALKDGVSFDRSSALSPVAEDANDPGARGVDYSFLAGCTWWLGAALGAPLKLCGLDVFPIALEHIYFPVGGKVELCLVARLQLPVLLAHTTSGAHALEQTQRSNSIRLTFDGDYGSPLALTKVEAAPAPGVPATDQAAGEWPLTADEAGPIITWEKVSISSGKLTCTGARLGFGLFGQNWEVALDPLVFVKNQNAALSATINQAGQGITVSRVAGSLVPSGDHQAELRLVFAWGDDVRLEIEQSCGLIPPFKTAITPSATWVSEGGSLPLHCSPQLTSGLGFQSVLSFDGASPAGLQLLPGMSFAGTSLMQKHVAGFAAVAFTVGPAQEFHTHLLPHLGITAAAAELIAPAQWGGSLQDAPTGTPATTPDVFGSSAGDLFANFSAHWTGSDWNTGLLLNGWLEVKNLISWPESLVSVPDAGDLVVRKTLTILFEDGTSTLPAGSDAIFKQVADLLVTNRCTVQFEGHASDTGDGASNLILSHLRATTVRNAFVQYLRDNFHQPQENQLIALVDDVVAYGENRLAVLAYDEDARRLNRRVTLIVRPLSVRIPTAADSLNHDRHTLRILLNQHTLGGDVLGSGPKGTGILATIARDSWAFIAVVQHELTRIRDVTNAGALVFDRRRWTVAQEVRLVPAGVLADTLVHLSQEDGQDPITGSRQAIGDSYQWALRKAWLVTAGGANAIRALAPALVVEASVPVWLRTPLSGEAPLSLAEPSALQYLPGGTPRASLTNPSDFGAARQGERPWLFASLPFLGRLQPAAADASTTVDFARDPVLSVFALRGATRPAVLSLTCREAANPVWAYVRDFDDAESHRFERLTEGALEEGLYRYLHPASESDGTGFFAPVMAALPANSPGRATRPAALAAALDASRQQFPPGARRTSSHVASTTPPPVIWGKSAWFGQQAGARFDSKPPLPVHVPALVSGSPQAFFFPAFVLRELWLVSAQTTFPAATALPVDTTDLANNNQPATVAVSPCTALDFVASPPTQDEITLVTFGEVLAVTIDSQGQGALRPVLSTVWIEPGALPRDDATRWAREAVSELAPESAVVIVRLRSTVQLPTTKAIVTRFAHLTADSPALAPAEPPSLNLRSDYRRLRFADAQVARGPVPGAARRFEFAPPLTVGAQPIWSLNLKSELGPDATRLSALRFAVRTLEPHGPAVVGPPDIGTAAKETAILWWQTLWHQVAFDIDPSGRLLLPPGFRAPARRGYTPVPLQLKAPESTALTPLVAGSGEPWQPLLPAAVDCILMGARPGAPFLVRPLTITQHNPLGSSEEDLVTGASVPVQHRFPRPVPLPANDATKPAVAHQPWASFVFPTANHLDAPDTFPDIAAFDLLAGPQYLLVGLQAVIQESRPLVPNDKPFEVRNTGGIILGNSKTLAFELTLKNASGTVVAAPAGLSVGLTDDTTTFSLDLAYSTALQTWRAEPAALEAKAALSAWVGKKPHGTVLNLEISVEPQNTRVGGYHQLLRLPVQVCDPVRLRASLERQIIHFEDPAYNRALASTPSQKIGELLDSRATPPLLRPIMLAVDRREYNPTSILLGVFADVSDALQPPEAVEQVVIAATITVAHAATYDKDVQVLNLTTGVALTRVNAAPAAGQYTVDASRGVYTFSAADVASAASLEIRYRYGGIRGFLRICLVNPESGLPEPLGLPGNLENPHLNNDIFSVKLGDLTRVTGNLPLSLVSGDALLIQVWSGDPNLLAVRSGPFVEVAVKIVTRPVTPPPDHAYALLAADTDTTGGPIQRAHCVRFAWSPFPDRIELLDPDDLLRNSVRRHAVFRWLDAVVPDHQTVVHHGVQKIAPSGATHWPLG